MFLIIILYSIHLAITFAKMDTRIDELEMEIRKLKKQKGERLKCIMFLCLYGRYALYRS